MSIKKYQKPILIIMFFSLIFSCGKDIEEITPINLIKLPKESEVFKIDVGCYENVIIVDTFLIMTTMTRCDDDKIHVFNKKDLQLITKFGKNGLASFDFPAAIPLNSTMQRSNSIIFYDPKTGHFKTVNLTKFLSEGNIANSISSTAIDKNLFFSTNLNQLNDNHFAGTSLEDRRKGLFFIYNTQTEEKIFIEHVPKSNIEDSYKTMLYYGTVNANSSKNTILYTSRFFDYVLFYDLKGSLQKKYFFSSLKMPTLSPQTRGPVYESMIYAFETYVSPEYCFVQRIGQGGMSGIQEPTQLLVFNWDGVFLNAFELPLTKERIIFCYDEELGYLYLFESSQEENDPYVIVHKYKINDYIVTD